jgi:hypothetical protein
MWIVLIRLNTKPILLGIVMQKLIKDGKVAVLISPGFGAGWSTWASGDRDELLFDADIAQAVLDGMDSGDLELLAKSKYPKEFLGGLDDLEVQWVDQGTEFIVEEYDGSESIRYKDGTIWSVA